MTDKHMKLDMKKLLFLLFLSFNALADTAVVEFLPPTEREDNTLLTANEIAGYLVVDQNGLEVMPQLPANAVNFTLEIASTIILNVITIDTDGRRSLPSTDVVLSVVDNPKPPTVTSVTVLP